MNFRQNLLAFLILINKEIRVQFMYILYVNNSEELKEKTFFFEQFMSPLLEKMRGYSVLMERISFQ